MEDTGTAQTFYTGFGVGALAWDLEPAVELGPALTLAVGATGEAPGSNGLSIYGWVPQEGGNGMLAPPQRAGVVTLSSDATSVLSLGRVAREASLWGVAQASGTISLIESRWTVDGLIMAPVSSHDSHNGPATCMDGSLVHGSFVSGGEDGALVVTPLESKGSTWSTSVSGCSFAATAWTGANSVVGVGSSGLGGVWDVRSSSGSASAKLGEKGAGAASSVVVHPTQREIVAVGRESGLVVMWDLRSPSQPVARVRAHSGPVWSLLWHPEATNTIVSAGEDGTVLLWDLNAHDRPEGGSSSGFVAPKSDTDTSLTLLFSDALPVNAIGMVPNSNLLVAAGDAGSLFVETQLLAPSP